MVYDLQKMGNLIAEIKKYLNELRSYNIKEISDLEDGKTYNASSMVVFAILTKVIDLGGEIINAEELGAPNRYSDIMTILAKANVINKKRADELNKLVAQRNVLAHFYGDIKEKDLLSLIKEMRIVEDFVETVRKRVKLKG